MVVVFVTLRVTAVLISRSMEGVMNQLKQYEGPWDLGQRKAEDQARRKAKRGKTNTKELKKAADEEKQQQRDDALKDVSFAALMRSAEAILAGADTGEEQRKLNKKAREAEADRQKDAAADAKRLQRQKAADGPIMWTPKPNKRRSGIIRMLDKQRDLSPSKHSAQLRQLNAVLPALSAHRYM